MAEQQLQKIKIITRIRPPYISETYSVAAHQAASGQMVDSLSQSQSNFRQSNGMNSGSIAAGSSLDKDSKICVFTSSSIKEKATFVAASGNPIKKQLLQDYIKSDKNIVQYRHSILENANIFKFDQAINPKVSNLTLYKEHCQLLVQQAFSNGISPTFIILGPAKAGKKYTVKGGEQTEKGILTCTVENLLQLSELQTQGAGMKLTSQKKRPVQIGCSIFAIYNNEVIDLLSEDQNASTSSGNLTELEVLFSGEYRKYYSKAKDRLKNFSQSESSLRKLHVVYKFSIYRNQLQSRTAKNFSGRMGINSANGGLISTVTIIHCADFSKSRMPEFQILSDFLVDVATRRDINLMDIPAYQNSNLISMVHDQLNPSTDNLCLMICAVSGSYDYLSQSVDCLQFSAGIKERIDLFFEDAVGFEENEQDIANNLTGGNELQNESLRYNRANPDEQIHIVQRNNVNKFQRKRRRDNPGPNEIIQDLKSLIKDAYSFSDSTQGFKEDEIIAWAENREQELRDIMQDIDNLPLEEKERFEPFNAKIEECFEFLQQVKKNATQLASGQIQMNKRVENLDELINDYERQTWKDQNKEEQEQEQISEQENIEVYVPGIEKNLKALQNQIANLLEEALGGDTKHAILLQNMKDMLSDQKKLVKEKQRKLKKEKKEVIELNTELKAQVAFVESELNESANLAQHLQNQNLQLNEQIEKDMEIIQLKIKKEELLLKNEEELRELIDRQQIKFQKKKQEHLVALDKLDKGLREREAERINFEEERKTLLGQIDLYGNYLENERLKVAELQVESEKLSYDLERETDNRERLEEELKGQNRKLENISEMYGSEQNLNKELLLKVGVLQSRIDEEQEKCAAFEGKLSKTKQKNEQEKKEVIEEKEEEINKKKETISKLKGDIRDTEKKMAELSLQLKNALSDNKRNSETQEKLDSQKVLLTQKNNELAKALDKAEQEIQRQKQIHKQIAAANSIDKLEKNKEIEEQLKIFEQLKKSQQQVKILEEQIKDKNRLLDTSQKELANYQNDRNAQAQLVIKLDRQNQFLSDSQQDDIQKLEEKVDHLRKELNEVKRENKILKEVEQDLQFEIREHKQNFLKQSQKLSKDKYTIQHLNTKLSQTEKSVKELVNQSSIELNKSHNQQRSILKKPRFNLVSSDSDDSQHLNSD